jgi:hypothetical protein
VFLREPGLTNLLSCQARLPKEHKNPGFLWIGAKLIEAPAAADEEDACALGIHVNGIVETIYLAPRHIITSDFNDDGRLNAYLIHDRSINIEVLLIRF